MAAFVVGAAELPNPLGISQNWVFRILSGIQFTTHFIDFLVVETKRVVSSSLKVILTGKPAANARAGLRKANAERWIVIFPSELATCSSCQNVEETEM